MHEFFKKCTFYFNKLFFYFFYTDIITTKSLADRV